VPSNTAGLSIRRLLAAGALGGAGLANVDLVTPFRLAELLGSAAMGSRRPLSNAVLAAAVRTALRCEPGRFAAVADHAATQAAVLALYGELSRALPATLAAVARSAARGPRRSASCGPSRLASTDHHDEDDLPAPPPSASPPTRPSPRPSAASCGTSPSA
jgi:hypothetical protein